MRHSPAVATPPIARGLLFAFALPGILQGFMQAPGQSLLQGIYAKESGLALIALGGAVLSVRLIDVLSDFLIGYFSDRSAEHGISRKWWMGAGTIVTAIALWFLFRPPADVSITYYAGWFLLANIGWSLCEIPYRAWSLEFSPEPAERTRITVSIALATLIGTVLFYSVAPVGNSLGLLKTGELNLEMLGLTAVVVVLLLPPLNFFALWRVPDGQSRAARGHKPPPESWRLLLGSVLGNVPLIRLIIVFSIASFMTGMSQGVTLLYMTNYLGLGTAVNYVMASALPISVLGLPLWGWLVRRYPLQRTWAVGIGLGGLTYATIGFFPPQPNVVGFALVHGLLLLLVMSTLVAAPVILGDIIDYGKEHYGVDRAGLYMSFWAQIIKTVGALSAGGGLIFLGWMGFDASKSGADLTPQAVSALKLVVAWTPAAGFVVTALLLWFVPISAQSRRLAAARKNTTALPQD
ncbi:MFS transporter [Solimonas sp. SE-A11]|uniref:MFS transporter n=1 Tax=Solimonas sp. SE-A11 TaxID=3054954 RepID=UPI00259C94B4|nr:MFS transporter [Solimonas sp. SE-A11]MDM4772540.1 MFS transporter [Solimonas sp. SE-A11]